MAIASSKFLWLIIGRQTPVVHQLVHAASSAVLLAMAQKQRMCRNENFANKCCRLKIRHISKESQIRLENRVLQFFTACIRHGIRLGDFP